MVDILAAQEDNIDMPTWEHRDIIAELISVLRPYAKQHGLGRVFAPQTTYHIPGLPDRDPDISFVYFDRLPANLNVDPDIPPDLAVEVASRSDTLENISSKVQQYLRAGVRMVWMVNPWLRTVDVYEPHAHRVFNESDTLSGDPVVPGFTVPVRQIFP